ncbi:GntR family transcriptional regulator [Echinicola sediminis]
MDFKLDHSSPVPFHAQIEKYLRELVQKEEYLTGEQFLPKETALSKSLGVSRNTIRQAINKLVHEGIVERKKGVGTKVIQQKISTRLDNWISFTKEMRNKGIDVVDYMVAVDCVPADVAVCKALSIEQGREVWRLQKVRGAKDAKYLYSVSYFHPRVGITGKENFNQPLYELLENDHHVVVTVSKEKLKAVMPGEKVAQLLDMEESIPVLKRERMVCDRGDRPVEYNLVYYHTNYFSYDIDIKREL